MDDNGTRYPGKDGQWPNDTVRDVTHTSEIDQLRIDLSEARRQLASEREQLAVNVDFVKQYQREVSELRRQLAEMAASAKKANEDAGMYLWEVGQWQSQCIKAEARLSAAQKKLWNAESEVVLLRAERNAAREQLTEARDSCRQETIDHYATQSDLAEARSIVTQLFEIVRATYAGDYRLASDLQKGLPAWADKRIRK